MTLEELIAYARQTGCSDIHLTQGRPTVLRRLGQLVNGELGDDAAQQQGQHRARQGQGAAQDRHAQDRP